ncbi:hypothetical protein [Lysobacter sp. CA199]|uniref:hypothetical protein n=1 Tax=Lysobacter sp. CA199 TaxID=3455608 RepID=UPI003F8D3522
MEDVALLLVPVLIFGLNLGLWRLARGYTRFAGVMMFVLSALIASPLIGMLSWEMMRTDIETSYAGSDGDAFFAIGAVLLNGVVALVGAVAAALRGPVVPAQAPVEQAERVRLRSD